MRTLSRVGCCKVKSIIGLVAVPAARHHPAAVLERAFLDVEDQRVLAGPRLVEAETDADVRSGDAGTRRGRAGSIAAPPTGWSFFGFGGNFMNVQVGSPNAHSPYCAVIFQRPSTADWSDASSALAKPTVGCSNASRAQSRAIGASSANFDAKASRFSGPEILSAERIVEIGRVHAERRPADRALAERQPEEAGEGQVVAVLRHEQRIVRPRHNVELARSLVDSRGRRGRARRVAMCGAAAFQMSMHGPVGAAARAAAFAGFRVERVAERRR